MNARAQRTAVSDPPNTPQAWLDGVLSTRVERDALAWLRAQAEVADSDRDFYRSFAWVARKLKQTLPGLSDVELTHAELVRPGWDPRGLRLDQLARLWLLLSISNDEQAARCIDILFITADVAELVTLYRGLPILPIPERWCLRAAEGIRSNIQPVYEAVALHNPYPSEWLADGPWNQLVLKALHLDCAAAQIHGLSARMNADLLRMLRDYACERRSAGRALPAAWNTMSAIIGDGGNRA